ncbi:DUF1800 domain-containing protein [Litorisediminicola beolgyonensis]|uniref:DUF1800 family protein n=1 Tax=Litorisediminicola beolgyonensis TaxID=1173614 RepID=A0ABW3ZGJ9_9RHOB
MIFSPELAEIRFGCGLSPVRPAPASVEAMLAGLSTPDRSETPRLFSEQTALLSDLRDAGRRIRKAGSAEETRAARTHRQGLLKQGRQDQATWLGLRLIRRVETPCGFRERLAAFWADHFTVAGRTAVHRSAISPYLEEAMRPNLTGPFATLLEAAVLHPAMMIYLDQVRSVGPNSRAARDNPRLAGLNENLAREILELHTLGVDGGYRQDDVRALAILLTGASVGDAFEYRFMPRRAEPGPVVLLGRRFERNKPEADLRAALQYLAGHPATAAHLARKLAVHFLGDTPDPDAVAAMTAALLRPDAQLRDLYDAMLTQPAAWDPRPANVKPAFDFLSSALRALGPDAVAGTAPVKLGRGAIRALALMGHRWEEPVSPAGLPEEDAVWIAPQALAARVQWAMSVPKTLMRDAPDPRDFAIAALGSRASPLIRFAAAAAETRWDGVGVVLSSPAFQRS